MSPTLRADRSLPPFEFQVPPEREAHEPPEARGLARDEVRLLVSYLHSPRVVHAQFKELARFLLPSDLLVVNVSATLPAALTARRGGSREVAVHLSTRLPADLFIVEFRNATVAPGDTFALPEGGSVTALTPYPGSTRLWVARLELPAPLEAYLARWGHPIAYPYVRERWPIDAYQTVYAAVPGSAEMPSAGRPFSPAVLQSLAACGIEVASVVLHTGVASLEHDEPPYEEWFDVPHDAAAAVRASRAAGGRVIAVGTTVVRALESAVDAEGRAVAARGWTDLVVTPERGIRLVDGLLTGFHEPRATHLAVVEAVAGRAHVERVYRLALEAGYLWHEFGDLHLILPD